MPIAIDGIYHVFNRSIAQYKIFNGDEEYQRMQRLMLFYQYEDSPKSFSMFINKNCDPKKSFCENLLLKMTTSKKAIQVIAYCIMPNHIHLVLKQTTENGIERYLSNVLNAYVRYFNLRHKRKGPLWEGRSKKVQVSSDDQLLHLTRYIHINPATAGLIEKPEEWLYSSYSEFIDLNIEFRICKFDNMMDIIPRSYKEFVDDQIPYQQELAMLKSLYLD